MRHALLICEDAVNLGTRRVLRLWNECGACIRWQRSILTIKKVDVLIVVSLSIAISSEAVLDFDEFAFCLTDTGMHTVGSVLGRFYYSPRKRSSVCSTVGCGLIDE